MDRRRLALLLPLAVLACGVLALLLRGGGGDVGVLDGRESPRVATGAEQTALEGPVRTGERAAGSRARVDPAAAPAESTDVSRGAAPAPKERASEGRLLVHDPDRSLLTRETGVLEVVPWRASVPTELSRLDVEDGRFDLSGLGHDVYRVHASTMESPLGPRSILFDDPVFPLEGEVVLRGRYAPRHELRVLDAATGANLDGVRVLEHEPDREPDPGGRVPGPHSPSSYLVHGVRSPIPLPPARGAKEYWVTADGYGWKRVAVDHETPGETVVRLDPAGDLHVEVTGHTEHVNSGGQCRVVVVGDRGEVLAAGWLDGGSQPRVTHRLRAFPAGRHEVRVASGGSYGQLEVLARQTVQVRAGALTVARLNLPGGSFGRPSAVRLEVVGAPDLLGAARRVSLRRSDAVRHRRHDAQDVRCAEMNREANTYFRGVESVTPGRYRLVVSPTMDAAEVEVLASTDDAGEGDEPECQTLRVKLAEPRTLAVRALDARGGTPVEGARVSYLRVFDPELSPSVVETVPVGEAEGSVTLALATGEYAVTARAPGYALASDRVRVDAGRQALDLWLEPVALREVQLIREGSEVPWPDGATCELLPGGDEEPDHTFAAEGGKLYVNPPPPGVSRLRIRGLTPSGRADFVLETSVHVEGDAPLRVVVAR